MKEMDFHITGVDIAVAGQLHVLTRRGYITPQTATELLAISEWSAGGRLNRLIEFDLDDLDAALAELAEAAGEPVVMVAQAAQPTSDARSRRGGKPRAELDGDRSHVDRGERARTPIVSTSARPHVTRIPSISKGRRTPQSALVRQTTRWTSSQPNPIRSRCPSTISTERRGSTIRTGWPCSAGSTPRRGAPRPAAVRPSRARVGRR